MCCDYRVMTESGHIGAEGKQWLRQQTWLVALASCMHMMHAHEQLSPGKHTNQAAQPVMHPKCIPAAKPVQG